MGLLEAAIAECEKEAVEGEVNLHVARKRLATLRAAAERLRPMSPKALSSIEEQAGARGEPLGACREHVAGGAVPTSPWNAKLLRLALQEAISVGLTGPQLLRAQGDSQRPLKGPFKGPFECRSLGFSGGFRRPQPATASFREL